jgi:TM2 domain-containing membrane protein YozV
MKDNNELFAIVLAIFMSIFGAAAKYLSTLRNSKFSVFLFWSNMFVAAFIGFLIALLCSEYEISINLAGVAAGVAGYAGHIFLDKLAAKFEKIIEKKSDEIL